MAGITCGVDWAEGHHDVAIIDASGTVLARRRIDTGVRGFTELEELFALHSHDPAAVPVAIETDKNLLVVALHAAGHPVYAINPRAVARYRERHGQAGGKSDPGDALVLADILRTDAHRHRSMAQLSQNAQAIKALARQHQEAIWAEHQTISRLRSVLLEFYPQALQAFPQLKHKAALAVLATAPTPAQGKQLTRRQLVALLHRCGRRNDPALVDRVLAELTAPSLGQPAAVEAALGLTVAGLVQVITAMQGAVASLEDALAAEFDRHHLAPVLRSAPGLGPVLAARVLAEIGDDPTPFATAQGLRAFAGTAPITRASGRSRFVNARRVRNKRPADACHWWAFSMLTKSPGARAHYDRRRATGETHNAALRNLANKNLGRLWWCLANEQPWDENQAWPATPATPRETAA
ncbi:IS110 family transposase [Allobranchiibius sp. GilTou38]|uniref:IS110 family transposase n=1 Tax=Allobranchiibius sp. GilTou38 TaxID=2815210 RepID=UPI001AA1AEC6|nr:IS110 family transposase [Allobranchiibius sp. GilTou38]